jgi:hypothetical protein
MAPAGAENWPVISSMNVLNSTRIDNEKISTAEYFRILTGEAWLSGIDKNWRKTYLRPENPQATSTQPGK